MAVQKNEPMKIISELENLCYAKGDFLIVSKNVSIKLFKTLKKLYTNLNWDNFDIAIDILNPINYGIGFNIAVKDRDTGSLSSQYIKVLIFPKGLIPLKQYMVETKEGKLLEEAFIGIESLSKDSNSFKRELEQASILEEWEDAYNLLLKQRMDLTFANLHEVQNFFSIFKGEV